MLKVLLISIPVLVVLLGIFLLVTLILKRKIENSKFNPLIVAAIIVLLISAILLAIGAMLIRDPKSIFVSLHWLWILGGGIIAPVLLILAGAVWCNHDLPNPIFLTQWLLAVCVFVMMVSGLLLAPKATYEFSEPQDINLLKNLPKASGKTYHFTVVNDIDFSGFEFKKTYEPVDTFVIIDGNGYTWSNIEYEVTADFDVTFLDIYGDALTSGHSKIKNLSIVDSSFSIIPNGYNEETHEGYGIDFYLFPHSNHVKLENVKIDITVYCGEAEENIRSNSPSFVEKIYPETGYDKENNVDITVRVME